MPTVTRNIQFYTVRAYKRSSTGQTNLTALHPFFTHIQSLPPDDGPGGSYMVDAVGNAKCMDVDALSTARIRGRYANVRRKGLPSIDKRGSRRPIPLTSGEGLYEPSHFILFDGQVLGFERNTHGPRASSLENYLPDKAPSGDCIVTVRPILSSEVSPDVSGGGGVKSVYLRVAKESVGVTRKLDPNLFAAMKSATKASTASDVEIAFLTEPHSRERFRVPWLKRAAGYLKNPVARDATHEFLVEASRGGRTRLYNLLEEAIVYTRQIETRLTPEGTVVDAESAYSAIEDAYASGRSHIRRIVGSASGDDTS